MPRNESSIELPSRASAAARARSTRPLRPAAKRWAADSFGSDVSRAPRLLGDCGVQRVIRTRWGLAAPQSSSVSGQRQLIAQERRAHSRYLVETVFVPAGMPPRARILLSANHAENGLRAHEG